MDETVSMHLASHQYIRETSLVTSEGSTPDPSFCQQMEEKFKNRKKKKKKKTGVADDDDLYRLLGLQVTSNRNPNCNPNPQTPNPTVTPTPTPTPTPTLTLTLTLMTPTHSFYDTKQPKKTSKPLTEK